MKSLRWRIATWYALLLVAVIVIVGAIFAWRFQAILYAQAKAHVNQTMEQIALVAQPQPNLFSIYDNSGKPIRTLLTSENLEQWASPTSYVQVDTVGGYPLAHSGNVGSALFPPARGLTKARPRDFRTVQMPAGPFLVEDQLMSSGGQSVVVHVAEPMNQLLRAVRDTMRDAIVILAAAIAAVVALSVLLARQAVNPIDQLARAMREIGSDRLDRRLKWAHRKDEIGRLAATFDDLLARLEEAFARERQFIADASHELRTPLTSINANAQMLARWGDGDPAVRGESLATIVHESSSLAHMVSGMLTLAKADSGESISKEPLSLTAIAADAVRSSAPRAAEKGLALEFDAGDDAPIVIGEPNLLRQLVTNLVDNAIKFTPRGRVIVRVRARGNEAVVEVQDTGPGIDPGDLPLIFDRFYRADKSRNRAVPGTGLGLAIVRSIARVHDGLVEAEHPADGGSLFRVRFPRVAQEASGLT